MLVIYSCKCWLGRPVDQTVSCSRLSVGFSHLYSGKKLHPLRYHWLLVYSQQKAKQLVANQNSGSGQLKHRWFLFSHLIPSYV